MTTTSSTSSTSSSSGSAILTALGAGSGIDTDSLVTNLVAATYDPKDQTLKTKEDANTAQISSLGTLTSGIDAFASALQSLVAGGTLKSQPTSSDSSVLTATVQSGASIGALAAQLEVRQVATAQSVYSTSLANSGTAVGTGSLKLTTAAGAYTITVDSSNNSLAGLANAINATNSGSTPSGVTASVITDANGARLVIKGQTGAANSFTVDANSDATADLARFTTSASGTHLITSQTAANAIIRLDGVDSSFGSNSVSNLVPGVTLNLVSASPGTTISLGVNRPTDAITQAVSDYVSAYNQLKTDLNTATAVGSGGSGQGPLYGNAAVKQMQRQLQQITSTALSSNAGGPQTLAEIGVSTNQDGTLSVDTSRLSKTLAAYPDAVEAMFNPSQRSDNPLIKITSAFGSTKPGSYTLTGITAGTPPSGTIAGVAGLPSATDPQGLVASITSPAAGLAIQPLGNVASATITVDAGLSGVLQGIRDSLRATGGILDTLSSSFDTQKTKLADDRTKMETQESAYKDQLTTQFSVMQGKVATYKSIQSYLTQQIALWSKSS